jgi:phage shock protein PspC (stress-responsive transcriptional regulator)
MWRLWATWQDRDVATTDLLHRSVTDARVAGVCGGIAERYRIDPLLVRLAAVIIALSSGVGLVLYGAAWLLLPRGAGQPALMRAFPRVARVRSRTWSVVVSGAALVVLVLVGVGFNASLLPTMVVLGILYASQLRPGTKGSPAVGPGSVPQGPQQYETMPGPMAGEWPLLAPPPGQLIVTTPAGPWRPTNRWGQPLTAQECATYYAVPDPIGLYQRPQPVTPQRRSRVIALVAGLAIAAIFAMMSLLGAFVLMPPVTYLAVGLVGVGVTLIVGAFTGRPSGFIAIAIALVLVAGAVSSSSQSSNSQQYDSYFSTSDLPDQISVNGNYVLDLSQLPIDETKSVAVQVDNGNAQLVLPASGNYSVSWNDSYGNVTMPDGSGGQGSGGYNRILDPSQPTLTLSITVTSGSLVVRE